ncbi:MAG: prepilin-type N-terminal cleavage/methylation domain-containing protein [Thermodesulfobacteriota bacterium]
MSKASIPRNILRNPKGLSLLETLIAIIILAVSLTSISYFFSTARGNIETSGHMRCGLVLAQDKMEQLKDLGYTHADLSVGTHSDRVDSTGDAEADDRPFYREWTVTAPPDNADGIADDDDYKLVQLRVYDQRLAPGSGTLDDPDKLVAELKTYISP